MYNTKNLYQYKNWISIYFNYIVIKLELKKKYIYINIKKKWIRGK